MPSFPPVHICIYCGDRSAHLQDEHIIPFALDGDMILPMSSCRSCAKITGKIEGKCLNQHLKLFRTKIGHRSRRPKPNAFDVRITAGKELAEIRTAAPGDLPLALVLPTFFPPRFFMPEMEATGFFKGAWVGHETKKAREWTRSIGPDRGFTLGAFNPAMFSRMVSKIAYSYAVAKLGLDSFTPICLDHILKGVPSASAFFGTDPNEPVRDPDVLHSIKISSHAVGNHHYVVVFVQLFVFLVVPV